MSVESYVVISDLQIPYHNRRAVDSLCEFIRDYGFDGALNVGDDIDAPEPSRWNKSLAGEYAGTLQRGFDVLYDVHGDFRSALGADKPFHLMRSNHGDRVQTYIRKYAPALESLDCLDIEQLAGYGDHDITYHRQPFEFWPGWVLLHGDEGGSSISPGGTALGLVKKTGRSVVCGHTHALGMQHYTTGVNGRQKHLYGLETGHLMDVKKAGYLATGTANWQTGFAILQREGSRVTPCLVPVNADGSFIFSGTLYRDKSASKTVIS